MSAQPILEPLIAAGLVVAVRPDGRLAVTPSQSITPWLDSHIRAHRDEILRALTVTHVPTRRPLDWPPPEPPWFADWMRADDERRRLTMAAGLLRRRPR